MKSIARELRAEFSADLARDPRGFKKRVVRLLKQELPPRSGRPPEQVITRAAEMRAQGKTWREIYTACLPLAAGKNARRAAQGRLRDAVRKRIEVRHAEKKMPNNSGGKKEAPFFPLRTSGTLPEERSNTDAKQG